jgi:hypothetical protein
MADCCILRERHFIVRAWWSQRRAVHPAAKALVISSTRIVEALDVFLEKPKAKAVLLHRNDRFLKQRIERAQQVIGRFDQLRM